MAQTVDQRSEFFFGVNNFFLEDIRPLCLEIAKSEQFDCKRLSVGAFVSTYYSMLELGYAKNVVLKITIYVRFVRKLLWYFFVREVKFAQTGDLLFDRRQLLLVSKLCKMILSTVRTIWIARFNDSHAYNQSGINIFAPNVRYETVV